MGTVKLPFSTVTCYGLLLAAAALIGLACDATSSSEPHGRFTQEATFSTAQFLGPGRASGTT